jgi:hypothetical protein
MKIKFLSSFDEELELSSFLKEKVFYLIKNKTEFKNEFIDLFLNEDNSIFKIRERFSEDIFWDNIQKNKDVLKVVNEEMFYLKIPFSNYKSVLDGDINEELINISGIKKPIHIFSPQNDIIEKNTIIPPISIEITEKYQTIMNNLFKLDIISGILVKNEEKFAEIGREDILDSMTNDFVKSKSPELTLQRVSLELDYPELKNSFVKDNEKGENFSKKIKDELLKEINERIKNTPCPETPPPVKNEVQENVSPFLNFSKCECSCFEDAESFKKTCLLNQKLYIILKAEGNHYKEDFKRQGIIHKYFEVLKKYEEENNYWKNQTKLLHKEFGEVMVNLYNEDYEELNLQVKKIWKSALNVFDVQKMEKLING